MGKKTRCTDRFVRYPYPKLYSNYKQNFNKELLKQAHIIDHKEVFNLEKETRINNPHKLESKTTMKDVYKGERGEH